jgi:hypothetical protein
MSITNEQYSCLVGFVLRAAGTSFFRRTEKQQKVLDAFKSTEPLEKCYEMLEAETK